MDWVYLDNNATTALDPRVFEAMRPFLLDQYANPSSIHQFGQQVRHAVETARDRIADLLGVVARSVIFTSGGTEANALAIRGTLAARPAKRRLITTAIEHDSVLRLALQIEKEGYAVDYVKPDSVGRLDPSALAEVLGDDVALVSVMHANNETGVIQPIEAIGALAAERGIPLHVDATQTIGKIPMNLEALPATLISLAAHKFHGPKGVGALIVKRGGRLRAQLIGGHQERDLRAGTENVAGIVGMAEALSLAIDHLEEENTRVRQLRDRLEAGILARVPTARLIGDAACRLPNTTLIAFETLEAEAILMLLSNHGICASSGSACSSGSLEPSHVLVAMGLDARWTHGAIRFSLSRFNTDADVDRTLVVVPEVITRLRNLQPRT